MPESPEHEFLKTCFNEILREFSSLRLYGFTETDRKRFDFSCLLERDWTRPVAGQVLWRNAGGIDKDIRTLLTDAESEIKVYLAADTVNHQSAFEETISDFRRSGKFGDLFRLKPIWIPSDFDADEDRQRSLVSEIVKSRIVEDILFNVVFGRIAGESIKLFLSASGIPGLNLVILHNIATQGFVNIATLAKRLAVSAGPIREKLPLLVGAGFIASPAPGALMFSETSKGRVFLDLVCRLAKELDSGEVSVELAYILAKLDCRPVSYASLSSNKEVFPKEAFIALVRTMSIASRNWGIDLRQIDRSKKIELSVPADPSPLA